MLRRYCKVSAAEAKGMPWWERDLLEEGLLWEFGPKEGDD